MSITSLSFLFCFLPISLMVYYIVKKEAKELVLLVISLMFYALGSPQYLILFMVSVVVTVTIGRLINSFDGQKQRTFLLVIGVIYNVGLLAFYKYYNSIIDYMGLKKIIEIDTHQSLILPLGISFFTFKAISYLIDVYHSRVQLDENVVHDALYLSFFPQIQSGPLARYSEMFPVVDKSEKQRLFNEGVYRFLIGFNKKVILANVLSNITKEIFSTDPGMLSTGYAWLGSICFSLQLFFDFAGYSDMAIGLSGMFGYNCRENFYYPYMTESISKFWRRWHISLSEWFRDYIYFPLGGSRCEKKTRVYFNLFVVWILTGIWHGSTWNFIAWGLGYFVLIAFERFTGWPDKLTSGVVKFIYRIFTLLFINFQWVLFKAENLKYGLRFIKRMVIYTPNELMDKRTAFLLGDNWFFIMLAFILCFPVVSTLENKVKENAKGYFVFRLVISLIIVFGFVWSLSFVIVGMNNPFAYAFF